MVDPQIGKITTAIPTTEQVYRLYTSQLQQLTTVNFTHTQGAPVTRLCTYVL